MPSAKKRKSVKKNKFPLGWTPHKVKKTLDHYEKQTEENAVLEDEAAYKDKTQTFIEIPKKLVSSVRKLLASHPA
jgi:hypothetical protein